MSKPETLRQGLAEILSLSLVRMTPRLFTKISPRKRPGTGWKP